jgi:hypothetical protein
MGSSRFRNLGICNRRIRNLGTFNLSLCNLSTCKRRLRDVRTRSLRRRATTDARSAGRCRLVPRPFRFSMGGAPFRLVANLRIESGEAVGFFRT